MPGSKVVEAFTKLRKSDLDVELHIFGDNSKRARETVSSLKNNPVVLHPRTTHKQSLKNISKCDFFLLAVADSPNGHVIMHSKLPHYLLLKKPIIAIVPPNSFVAQLISETGSGYIIPMESNWEPQLENIIRNYSEAKYISQRDEKEIKKYSWDSISQSWLHVLNGLPTLDSS